MKNSFYKNGLLVLMICVFSAPLYARGSEEREIPLTIYSIRGPSGVGLIRLFESPPKIDGFNISVEALSNAELMAARFISGEAKAGILPPNIAAKIASSGRDIRAAAVTATGMLSLLSLDPQLESIQGLSGKSVEVSAQGATPDYVFRRILRHRGLDPDRDLTLGYSLSPAEAALSLIAGRISTALLPEPFATMALLERPSLNQVADINEEWINAGGLANFPMTLFVVDGDFASSHPLALKRILEEVEASINWVVENPLEAGLLVEKHDLGLRASIAAAAIPKSSYVFIPAARARPSLEELFRVFMENDPVSIGDILPGDRFYLE